MFEVVFYVYMALSPMQEYVMDTPRFSSLEECEASISTDNGVVEDGLFLIDFHIDGMKRAGKLSKNDSWDYINPVCEDASDE